MDGSAPVGAVIRCDGSPEIGMGHVSRCLALAVALRGCGMESLFMVRRGVAAGQIQNAGFRCVDAPAGGAILPDEDARALRETARQTGAAGVIVDHYGAGSAYFQELKGIAAGVLDDDARRDLCDADWVLNAAPGFERSYPSMRGERLLGMQYALLRPAFSQARTALDRSFGADDARVLVTLGGGDVAGRVEEVARALEERSPRMDVQRITGSHPEEQMAQAMTRADVAVSAAGQTLWELACLGVPAVAFTLAENQRPNAQAMSAAACAVVLGDWQQNEAPARAAAAVCDLLSQPDVRRRMSAAGMQAVDGRGAQRAAEAIARRWQR